MAKKETWYWVGPGNFGGGKKAVKIGEEMPTDLDSKHLDALKTQGLVSTEKTVTERQLSELEQSQATIATLTAKVAELEKGGGGDKELKKKNAELEQKVSDLEKEIKDFKDKEDSAEKEKLKLESEISGFESKISGLEKSETDFKNKIESLSKSETALKKRCVDLEKKATDLETEIADLTAPVNPGVAK